MADGGIGNQSPATLFQARLITADGVSNTLTLGQYAGNKVVVSGMTVPIPTLGLSTSIADDLIDANGGDAGTPPAASTLYFVYVSNQKATFAPVSIRLSSTAPVLVNGVRYLGSSGNALNWRFVGWVKTNATPQFESTRANRLIVNYYNRLSLSLFANPGYVDDDAFTTYSHNSATYSELNGGVDNKVSFISNGEDEVHLEMVTVTTTGNGNSILPGIGIDSVTDAAISALCGSGTVSVNGSWPLSYDKALPEGDHFAAMLAYTNAAATIYADGPRAGSAADPPMTIISGFIPG